MARFDVDIENGIIKQMQKMELNSEKVFGEMVNAGADVVLRNIRSNMRASFKSTRSLERGLGKTRVFKTPSTGGIAVKVGFRGYSANRKSGRFKSSGVPIPLIASARERGTRRGEKARPFFKKSFNKSAITTAMKKIEPKLFEGVK